VQIGLRGDFMGWYVEYLEAKAEQEFKMQKTLPRSLGEAIRMGITEVEQKKIGSAFCQALCIEGHVRDLFTEIIKALKTEKACDEFMLEYERVFNNGGKNG
jgi:hypothetical protein